MTLVRNTSEGQTSGTNLTVALSGGGSGDALQTVNPSNTAAIQFSNARGKNGSQSYKVTSPAGTAHLLGFTRPANDVLAAAADYWFTGAPTTAATSILQVRNAGAQVGSVLYLTDGKLQVQSAAGTALGTTAAAAPTGQWVHIAVIWTRGTTTTDGRIQWKITNQAGTVLLQGDNAATNTGTAQLTEARFGKITSTANLPDIWIDDLAANDGSNAFIDPFPAGAATVPTTPVLTASSGDGQIGLSWVIGSDGGSAITSQQITRSTTSGGTYTALASQPAAGARSFVDDTAANGTTYFYKVTATNAVGTSTASNTASAQAVAGQKVAPIQDITTTGWTVTGGDGGHFSAIDELTPNDADYVSSPDNPSGAFFEVKLGPVVDPGVDTGFAIDYRVRSRSASTSTVVAALYRGTTLVASETRTNVPSTPTTYTLNLTSEEAATITGPDFSNLRVRITATAAP